MDTLSYKTLSANKETSLKKWLIVDAEGETLGRLASRVAFILRGKHKTNFTPHADCGDNVIVLNAEKITVGGNKENTKTYIHHTGYPGGQRVTTISKMREEKPERIIMKAVKGMLPKNKLASAQMRNLRIFVGTEHPHEAQQPEKIDLNTIK